MARTVLDTLIADVNTRRDDVSRALVAGAAKTYDEYRYMCGEIRGLTLAHNLLTDLVRRLENGDDSDEL